jgi:AcrR family transcriptional regulator
MSPVHVYNFTRLMPKRRPGRSKPPRREKSVETRDRIVHSAAELIATQKNGVIDVTINDIARRAGVTPALVIDYFGGGKRGSSRSFILTSIYRTFVGAVHKLIDTGLVFLTGAKPIEQLVAILRATVIAFGQMGVLGRVVLKETKDLDPSREEIKPIWKIFEKVDAIIVEAQRQKDLSDRVEADVIRQTLFGVTHTLLSYRYLKAGKPHTSTQPEMSDGQIEAEVLSVLKNFCNPENQQVLGYLDRQIEARRSCAAVVEPS